MTSPYQCLPGVHTVVTNIVHRHRTPVHLACAGEQRDCTRENTHVTTAETFSKQPTIRKRENEKKHVYWNLNFFLVFMADEICFISTSEHVLISVDQTSVHVCNLIHCLNNTPPHHHHLPVTWLHPCYQEKFQPPPTEDP